MNSATKAGLGADNSVELRVNPDPSGPSRTTRHGGGNISVLSSKWRERPYAAECSAPSLYYIDSLTLNRIPLYKDKALLHRKYVVEGLSTKQISSQFSCSTTAIKDHLHEFGIPIRKPRHHHGNPSIPKFGTKVRKGKSEPHVYAKRRAGAITKVSDEMWSEKTVADEAAEEKRLAEVGCNWVQKEVQKENPQQLLRVIK